MNWEIVAGLAVLLGMFATVISWSTKLTKSITMLEATISNLTKVIDSFKADNKQEHKDMHDQLEDHEKRITILEH